MLRDGVQSCGNVYHSSDTTAGQPLALKSSCRYFADIDQLAVQLNVPELKARVVYPLTSEVEDMELGELLDSGEFAVSAPGDPSPNTRGDAASLANRRS